MIEIHKKVFAEDNLTQPKCDSGEPSDVVMSEANPKAEPNIKGKLEAKSSALNVDTSKEASFAELDNLKPTDDVVQIYKVYWSKRHDQIVAKIQLKRAPKQSVDLGRTRQFGDILTKIPIRQLKDRKSEIFIDFMSELIKDEVKR